MTIASGAAVLLNLIEPEPLPQVIATIPKFIWELSPGIYLIVKGLRPSAIASLSAEAETNEILKAE